MHAITRGDLVYPDPIMHTNLHEMHINPQGYHIPQPSLQNPTFSSSEGHRNGQSEQDMERFIDIFLQVGLLISPSGNLKAIKSKVRDCSVARQVIQRSLLIGTWGKVHSLQTLPRAHSCIKILLQLSSGLLQINLSMCVCLQQIHCRLAISVLETKA